MKMVIVFLLIMTTMGNSLAWSDNEETTMKVLNDNDEYAKNYENGTEMGLTNDDVTDKSKLNTVHNPKSTLPPYKSADDKTPYLRGNQNKQTKPASGGSFPMKQTKPFISSMESNFQPQIKTIPSNSVSAQTLPGRIQFDSAQKQPYVAGQNKQQYLRGKQTKSFEESQENLGFSPEILVKNPDSNIFAQTIPSPIQFAQTIAKQPYVAGQNKQQYLRGRQSKPFPALQQDNETPTYILLNPRKQTKPTSNINNEKQSVPNQIQFVESQDNLGFSPQILVKNPNSNIFAQTIPSPIQFAKTVAKQPYVAGQNKQQYLRGRQTKPFSANQQDNDSPTLLLLPIEIESVESQYNPAFNPQIFVKNPDSNIFAQTLPSPIQFAQTGAKQPYIAGQNKQQYLRGRQTKPFQADQEVIESPAYILLNPIEQTKPFPSVNGNMPSIQTLPSPILFANMNEYSPQILVQTPSSGIFAQTVPSPIQFDQTVTKKPYIPGQNKQQYLRGRQAKPIQADQEVIKSPVYALLNPIKQTKPFPSKDQNMPSIETLQSPILFDTRNEYSPQILVQTPSSGIFAQTLPSPIQFDPTVAKKPYIPGQNKQQYVRGRQTKPFQADSQEKETPDYILLNPIRQTKPFPTEGQNRILAETLPSQIQQTKPFLSYQADAEEQLQVSSFLPGVSTRPRFPPGYTLPASRSAGSFLPGVSARPRFPPGYTLPAVARNVQTQEVPTAGYGGPKTVLYIF